jgi:hypothetical protein
MIQRSQTQVIKHVIEEIIAELPLKEKVAIANLDEKDIELLQHVFNIYVRGKVADDFDDEDADDIMNELWKRLQETYKLHILK